MTSKKRHQQPVQTPPRRLSLSVRLLLNFVVLGIGALLLSKAVDNNASYKWLWNTYSPNNLANIKMEKDLKSSDRDRLSHKLGMDFNYIMMLRDYTPENAIIYYPSKDDFLATPKYGEKLQFNGVLVDKMTAIRFLYPRKIVIREEWNKTPYSKRVNYVGIINGRNIDKLSYPVDSTTMHTVLPVATPTLNNQK